MNSRFLDLILGYERSEESFKSSAIARAEKKFSDRVISGIGSSYSKKFFGSRFAVSLSRIRDALAMASVRSWGLLFLVFGLVTLLMNFAEYYFRALPDSPAIELAIGAVFAVVAIPLMFIDMPLIEALSHNTHVSFLLFEVLCLRRRTGAVSENRASEHPIVPIIFGISLAALGYLFPLEIVLVSVALLVLLTLAISSPEFSFFMTLFSLPFIPLLPTPTLIMAVLVGITSLSFVIKVLLGKRLFHFEQYDAILLLFMLFILVSGIFNKGFDSFEKAISMIVLAFSYFLASNIIVNRRIAENAVRMIIFSSIPVAILGIITYYAFSTPPEWIDPSFVGMIDSRAYSTFGNPNIYAVYLVVTSIFSIAMTVDRIKSKTVIYYAIASILNVYSLIITYTRGAWLAVIISAAAFAIIRSRKCPKLLLVPALAIPIAIAFIPTAVSERFLSIFDLADSSVSSRLSIWRSSISMLTDNLFIGVGMGDGAFSEEFLLYAEDSVTAPHSHNLFLEIGCEAGIFALILFILMLFVRVSHRASYAKYVRNSSVDNLSTISGTALFGLIVFGVTDYIWYSSEMYVLFFMIFGIGSATLRIAKKEHDESLVTTPMESEDYAAEINVTIEPRPEKKERKKR